MTTCDDLTRGALHIDIAQFPTVEQNGWGLRSGTMIDLVSLTTDHLWLRVRLPGWDRYDRFGNPELAGATLVLSLPRDALATPAGLEVSDVMAAVRSQYGWDQYTAAFRL